MTDQEQRALMDQALSGPVGGRKAALDRLLEDFRGPALACIRRTLSKSGAAQTGVEDILQNAYLRFMVKGLTQYDGRASPRTYFCRIAIHAAVDALRRQKTRKLASLGSKTDDGDGRGPTIEDLPFDGDSPQDEVLELERRRILMDCLERLAPSRREAVLAYYFSTRNCAECADELGTSTQAVEQRLSRARRDLRQCLEENLEAPWEG